MVKSGDECLKNVSESFLFVFDGVAPGWQEAGEPPRVATEILVSPDGDSVVDVVYKVSTCWPKSCCASCSRHAQLFRWSLCLICWRDDFEWRAVLAPTLLTPCKLFLMSKKLNDFLRIFCCVLTMCL